MAAQLSLSSSHQGRALHIRAGRCRAGQWAHRQLQLVQQEYRAAAGAVAAVLGHA